MTKEDFIEKFGIDESDLTHVPECADIVTRSYFEDLADFFEDDAKRDAARFNQDEADTLPLFCVAEVDYIAIENYVYGIIESNYAQDSVNGLDFWWEV